MAVFGLARGEVILSSEEESRLREIHQSVERLLEIVKDPNSNIAISAFNDITAYREFYTEKGLIDSYCEYMERIVENTPHYEIKIAAIKELYSLGAWDSLHKIGSKTAGKNDEENVRVRRVITNLFYESINMLYDHSISGNISRSAGIGTGGISVNKTDFDQNSLIRYMGELAKSTGDKEIINKLTLLKRHKFLSRIINKTMEDIYSYAGASKEFKEYITNTYYKENLQKG